MNKQLKFITRTIFAMFIVLFFSVTMIQFVDADDLRANPTNERTRLNLNKIERGSILVDGNAIAYSTPTNDSYRFARQYSAGELYAPITGYYSRTQGMTGLEAAMDDELSGQAGSQFFTRLARTITGEQPQGSAVQTTIDPVVQEAAMEAMEGYEGAVVAVEPATGRILAMVSTPSFDPSLLSLNNDGQIIENYGVLNNAEDRPLINRAIAGDLYHPGSVYKLITTAAAIESGAATPETTFANPVSFTLPGTTTSMQNFTREACGTGSTVSLSEALIQSCNIPFAEMAIGMDRDEVPNMAEAFGFGHELSVPLEVTPSLAPVPGDAAEAAISSIGQLDVRATPLQMAMVSAGIANDGVVMKPYLIDEVIAPDLTVEQTFEPEVFATPISSSTAKTLSTLMEQVVSAPNGSAQVAALDGVRVAGKTGTAENGFDAAGNERPYTLWYTGFAPAQDPQIAIAVVIADGGGAAHDFSGTSYDLPTAVGKYIMEAVLKQ